MNMPRSMRVSEVGKRTDQGSDAVARTADAPEQGAAVGQQETRGAPMSRMGRKPSDRNGSTDWLGRGLRQLYQGTVNEPIPDKFRELLERLDQQEAGDGNRPPRPSKPGGRP